MKFLSTSESSLIPASLIMLFLVSTCGSCDSQKIPLPTGDNTPPTYKWVVVVQNDASDKYEFTSSNQTLNLGSNYQYTVSFIAYDTDGGIKFVSIQGKGLTACPQSPVLNIEEIDCFDSANLSPDMDNKVQTSAFQLCSVDVKCKHKSGTIFGQAFQGPGGNLSWMGTAENYYGGKVTSRLQIINQPGN